MNMLNICTMLVLCLFVCLASFVQAGGDKSAKTTVITLAGGGDKSSGYPIPIPIPVCTGSHGGFGGFGHGHSGGGHYGAQARMGWRRR